MIFEYISNTVDVESHQNTLSANRTQKTNRTTVVWDSTGKEHYTNAHKNMERGILKTAIGDCDKTLGSF